jgi:omega-6 fatty acid desaturase (delta-12 desaturase)
MVPVQPQPACRQYRCPAARVSSAFSGSVRYAGGVAVGFGRVAQSQLPIIALTSITGAWLFTVQHRSDYTVWAREDDWDAVSASLVGSTYLRLPRLLQWLTGNIGLHHVHHLNSKIPNYQLQQCHDTIAEIRQVPVMTLRSAFRAMFFTLWDKHRQRMVTFRTAVAG